MIIDELIAEKRKDPVFAKGMDNERELMEAGIALREAREKAGWTQKELATKANTSRITVNRVENGSNATVGMISSIASALGKKVQVKIV